MAERTTERARPGHNRDARPLQLESTETQEGVMLGEKIGEDKGRIIGQRVVSVQSGVPRMEVSFEETGRLLGLEIHGVGTYCQEPTGPGLLFGEGQGVVMGPNGETASWRGNGVGRIGKGRAASFRGCIYYTAPPGGKLARLNGTACVFEYEVDEEGNTLGRIWEWK
jgi:hypothetical protein